MHHDVTDTKSEEEVFYSQETREKLGMEAADTTNNKGCPTGRRRSNQIQQRRMNGKYKTMPVRE